MIIWKDRAGKDVEAKEFFRRWKEGIQKVTPLQQTQSQMFFTFMTIVGIVCGFIISLWQWDKLWWLAIILFAALGNTTIGYIGLYQRYSQLKKIQEMMKGGMENETEQKGTA